MNNLVTFFASLMLIGGSAYSLNFFQPGNYVKCCKPNEFLATIKNRDGISFGCKYDDNKILSVVTNSFHNIFTGSDCIDVLRKRNGLLNVVKMVGNGALHLVNTTFLPKCCPVHHSYDPLEHKCKESTFCKITNKFIKQHLYDSFVVVKSGMGTCRSLIVDHEFSTLQDVLKNVDEDTSFKLLNETFAYGKYCFDEVYSSNKYVVRICHANYNLCRMRKYDNTKPKCIRKCCPDGKVYMNRACKDDLFQGFNFINRTEVKSNKEPFSIIVPEKDCSRFKGDEDDKFIIDEKGYVRFSLVDNPPLYFSPFKESYCFENIKNNNTKVASMSLFICIKKGLGTSSSVEEN